MVMLDMTSRIRMKNKDAHPHESVCAWLAVILLVAVLTKASNSVPSLPSILALLLSSEIGKFVNSVT
jgi:hypothetical protein